ncbi:hypothetical protein EXIGLDRAFT_718536 [Exidia glandulosa HHB12029]|uniref:C2H2-type domain-containing protein n=1 Tax=Exidia glandulosa HHB12029 TaxID=1314781 RepID=A0A165NZK9_EXIGL|nr:hypothetical protein EXIGLDRAFT_718536 [Exidia glandulosa HHB12029]
MSNNNYPYGGPGYPSLPGLRELFDSRVQTPAPRAPGTPQPQAGSGSVFLQHAQGGYPQPQGPYPPHPQAYPHQTGVPAYAQHQQQQHQQHYYQGQGQYAQQAPPPPTRAPTQTLQPSSQSQFAVITPSGHTLAAADTYQDMISAARTARRTADGALVEDGRSCPYCGKVCDRPSTLRTHLNSHTGERPHTCYVPGCGRQFTVLSNMYRHAKTCTAASGGQPQPDQSGSGSGGSGGQNYSYQSAARR